MNAAPLPSDFEPCRPAIMGWQPLQKPAHLCWNSIAAN